MRVKTPLQKSASLSTQHHLQLQLKREGCSSQLCPVFCPEDFPILPPFFLFAGSVIFLLPSQTKFFLKLLYSVVSEEISYVIKKWPEFLKIYYLSWDRAGWQGIPKAGTGHGGINSQGDRKPTPPLTHMPHFALIGPGGWLASQRRVRFLKGGTT